MVELSVTPIANNTDCGSYIDVRKDIIVPPDTVYHEIMVFDALQSRLRQHSSKEQRFLKRKMRTNIQ